MGIVVALLAVLAGGAFAALRAGGDTPDIPEAGSAFGADPDVRDRGSSLLSALAPLLGAGRTAAQRSDDATAGSRPSGTRAPASDTTGTARGGSSGLGLPVDRAVTRLFVVGFPGATPDAAFFERLQVRDWGGVLLTGDNYTDPEQLATLTSQIGIVARNAGHGAPLVAARQAGGEDSAFPDLPPSAQTDQTNDDGARGQALAAGRALRKAGVTMTLAPDADLSAVGGPWDGRGFSGDGKVAAARTRAAVAGYRAARVIATVGHFPGEGAASGDPGLGPATVGLGLDELKAADLRPFAAAAGTTPVVQMSGALYAAFDGVTPATLLPDAVALLRGLGFRGVVLSADLGAAAFTSGTTPGDAAIDALNAGCDLLLLPGDADDQEQAVRTVVRAIRKGTVRTARVREALDRVAALKRRYAVRYGQSTAP
ncbi:glycoside hydrolase family 3 N-terminal domain-containing protein [Paraconexibacter sp.]|uniref:glycoside hydrolase family 3 N-terminal domain-containing protein n=1 Tax=Paraconexibacter sp. TaxID=2949640 RepID=UPI00356673ED